MTQNYEQILRQNHPQLHVFTQPDAHINNADHYTQNQIMALVFIGVERVRKLYGDHHVGAPIAHAPPQSELETIFWNENPDGGVILKDPASHLVRSNQISKRDLVCLAFIAIDRMRTRLRPWEKRNAPLPNHAPRIAGFYEDIYWNEAPFGCSCFTDPHTPLINANNMSHRQLLCLFIIGLERLWMNVKVN